MSAVPFVCLALLAGCVYPTRDLVGQPCPCPPSLVCDEGAQQCVDPGSPVTLTALVPSSGVLTPSFSPTTTAYTLFVSVDVHEVTLSATLRGPPGKLLIDGEDASAELAAQVDLDGRATPIDVVVTSGGGVTTYSIAVERSVYYKPDSTAPQSYGSALAAGSTSAGETLVVGVPDAPSAIVRWERIGGVYVYVYAPDGWREQQRLVPPRSSWVDGESFGTSVAISGDTIAVGATCTGDDAPTDCEGTVYVYDWNGSAWALSATVGNPAPTGTDQFGTAVALTGDVLAVGATAESAGGVVHVFSRAGSTWSEEDAFQPPSHRKQDRFGGAVAYDGTTLVVGASGESSTSTGIGSTPQIDPSNPAVGCGAVYVYTRDASGAWPADPNDYTYIKASNTVAPSTSPMIAPAHFGNSVALADDTIAVGAPFENSGATGIDGDQLDLSAYRNGAVYVFTRDDTGAWSQQAYVKASNVWPQKAINFGVSVALLDDDLLVGGQDDDGSSVGVDGAQEGPITTTAGAAYLFSRAGSAWAQVHFLKASNTGSGDNFGAAVALSVETIAVGAPGESSGATGIGGNQDDRTSVSTGAVYAFPRLPTLW